MFLLISKQGEVLGQTLSPENACRQAMIARTPMYAVTRQGELGTLPPETLRLLREDYNAASHAALWKKLKDMKFPYWGKVSVKKVLRSLFDVDGKVYTKDDLLKIVPGATWISITTAMSMLKNKEYADGKTLVITQVEGKYRRQ
jgi:hypothetical protein